ncbi:hypothetical protein UVI_02000710 [Ustilaginoidea virens]|uniref:Uncharacterized protein n=1 Tax=Ustilaginoidea virens TaxID=1159556 RepID=A0A1B5L4M3_USTVR|nr:hypothetical protein UVI_02000710 [Ustilaginoidea virens]
MHLLPSAALAVLLAAASPAAAQKYAPGKRNICVKENQKIGTPEIILWQGTDLCGGGVAKWPNSLPVGDKKVDPTVCCLDVHGYGNFYGVIQERVPLTPGLPNSVAASRTTDLVDNSLGSIITAARIAFTINVRPPFPQLETSRMSVHYSREKQVQQVVSGFDCCMWMECLIPEHTEHMERANDSDVP